MKSSNFFRIVNLKQKTLKIEIYRFNALKRHFQVFNAHKMFLGMASPVFDAMFYGGFTTTDGAIKILDVQPEAFKVMLE